MRSFNHFKKLYIAFGLILINVLLGTIGFILIENYTFLESFHMTIITVSTVGFGEVKPLSVEGRLFTDILIILSMSTYAYAISVITGYIINGELNQYFKNYKVNNKISKLENHVIVCGYGRNGKEACETLRKNGIDYLTVERNQSIISNLREGQSVLFIEGDSTNDDTLKSAGIERAKALITTLPADADNVFVVLTAREMNKKLRIISRASEDASVAKLKRAGADNVIMPDKIGGSHMASLVTKPDVLEFLDYLSFKSEENIMLEEVLIENLSESVYNKSIKELEIHHKTGANIIGYKSPNEQFIVNPFHDTILKKDAKLFVLGTKEQIGNLMRIFAK